MGTSPGGMDGGESAAYHQRQKSALISATRSEAFNASDHSAFWFSLSRQIVRQLPRFKSMSHSSTGR